jgi:hypothetical protein
MSKQYDSLVKLFVLIKKKKADSLTIKKDY